MKEKGKRERGREGGKQREREKEKRKGKEGREGGKQRVDKGNSEREREREGGREGGKKGERKREKRQGEEREGGKKGERETQEGEIHKEGATEYNKMKSNKHFTNEERGKVKRKREEN